MPNSATLLQALGAAFCAILCALSGMGGGGMMIGARTAAWAKSGANRFYLVVSTKSASSSNPSITIDINGNSVDVLYSEVLRRFVDFGKFEIAYAVDGYKWSLRLKDQLYIGFLRDSGYVKSWFPTETVRIIATDSVLFNELIISTKGIGGSDASLSIDNDGNVFVVTFNELLGKFGDFGKFEIAYGVVSQSWSLRLKERLMIDGVEHDAGYQINWKYTSSVFYTLTNLT